MMRDQFANYVVQKMLDLASDDQRRELVSRIRPHTSILRFVTATLLDPTPHPLTRQTHLLTTHTLTILAHFPGLWSDV